MQGTDTHTRTKTHKDQPGSAQEHTHTEINAHGLTRTGTHTDTQTHIHMDSQTCALECPHTHVPSDVTDSVGTRRLQEQRGGYVRTAEGGRTAAGRAQDGRGGGGAERDVDEGFLLFILSRRFMAL